MKFRDHHASCHGFNPVRPSGGEWTHAMMLHDGSTVYADTAAEIVEEMMPGLDSLDEPARSQARIRHAARTAAVVQQMVIDRARYEGTFDPDDAEVAPLVQILVTDKSLSLSLELPDTPASPPTGCRWCRWCCWPPAMHRPRSIRGSAGMSSGSIRRPTRAIWRR